MDVRHSLSGLGDGTYGAVTFFFLALLGGVGDTGHLQH